MAEKNDDIKQLFAHLGLNPGDYRELRNPPKTTAAREESLESRRNWSLLRAVRVATADQPGETAAMAATPSPVPRVELRTPPGLPTADSIERDVGDLSRAELERESLQSFFEAVKEPVSPAALDVPQDAPSIPQTTERRATEHLLDELRRVPETAAARVADLVRSRWPQERVVSGRPETIAVPAVVTAFAATPPASTPQMAAASPPVIAMPPSSAQPVPVVPSAVARLRLQFGEPKPAAVAAPSTETETLADVFRRLAEAGRQ